MNNEVLKVNIGRFICFTLLFGIIFIFSPPQGGDNDIWWHLKYGEHFVHNLTLYIDHSAFSWTPSNPGWLYVTWIGSSLLYIVYSASGFPGLFFLNSLLLVLVLGLYLIYLKVLDKKTGITDIFFMIIVAITVNSPYIKPDSFTTLFFACTVFVYFYSKTRSRSIFLLNIPLFLIWVNTHGGFIIGLFFISFVLVAEVLNFYLIKIAPFSRRILGDFALSVFLSYAILVINPYGMSYIISIFRDLFFSDYMEQSNNLLAFQGIWKQLSPKATIVGYTTLGWHLIVAMVFFMVACFYAYSKNKRIDPVVVTTNIIFFLAAMLTGRSAKFFPILWLFSITFILHPFDQQVPNAKLSGASLFLIALFAIVRIETTLTFNHHNSWFGQGFIDAWDPEKEASFIEQHKLPPPIFNDYLIGGYMIWRMHPEYKVFVDPRYGPFSKELLSDYFDLVKAPTYNKLNHFSSKYTFNTVFLSLGQISLIQQFMHTSEWTLVYFNTNAAVLVRTNIFEPDDQALISSNLGPERFSHIDDPVVLKNIFNLYNSLNLKREMIVIRGIYENNVSHYYFMRSGNLSAMDIALRKLSAKYSKPDKQFIDSPSLKSAL